MIGKLKLTFIAAALFFSPQLFSQDHVSQDQENLKFYKKLVEDRLQDLKEWMATEQGKTIADRLEKAHRVPSGEDLDDAILTFRDFVALKYRMSQVRMYDFGTYQSIISLFEIFTPQDIPARWRDLAIFRALYKLSLREEWMQAPLLVNSLLPNGSPIEKRVAFLKANQKLWDQALDTLISEKEIFSEKPDFETSVNTIRSDLWSSGYQSRLFNWASRIHSRCALAAIRVNLALKRPTPRESNE